MKLFQLMVEHTPDEESIDWTKIEPSVNFLKSPKGVCLVPLPVRPKCCVPVVPLPLWVWLCVGPGLLGQQAMLRSSVGAPGVCFLPQGAAGRAGGATGAGLSVLVLRRAPRAHTCDLSEWLGSRAHHWPKELTL